MAEIYDYYPGTLQDIIARITAQQEAPPSSPNPPRRRASASWDDAINQAGEIAEDVFEAFAEQAKSAVSNKLSKEVVFHCAVFGCKLALFTILRVGADRGIYGSF